MYEAEFYGKRQFVLCPFNAHSDGKDYTVFSISVTHLEASNAMDRCDLDEWLENDKRYQTYKGATNCLRECKEGVYLLKFSGSRLRLTFQTDHLVRVCADLHDVVENTP